MTAPADQLRYYRAQAGWTEALRAYALGQSQLATCDNALEVGCGGGWLTADLAAKVRGRAVGCDIDEATLALAREAYPTLSFDLSEPARLPYADAAFDFVCCHFTLLWAVDPVALLGEMRRVCAPGGRLAVLAEPDWGGFVEWPDLNLRDLVATALAMRGADPLAGRKLRAHLVAAGWEIEELGLTAGPWSASPAAIDAAWDHHRWTLAGVLDERRLRVIETKARRAWEGGARLVHLPLAWAIARR
jgi:SAM-dependent methyltransferase